MGGREGGKQLMSGPGSAGWLALAAASRGATRPPLARAASAAPLRRRKRCCLSGLALGTRRRWPRHRGCLRRRCRLCRPRPACHLFHCGGNHRRHSSCPHHPPRHSRLLRRRRRRRRRRLRVRCRCCCQRRRRGHGRRCSRCGRCRRGAGGRRRRGLGPLGVKLALRRKISAGGACTVHSY